MRKIDVIMYHNLLNQLYNLTVRLMRMTVMQIQMMDDEDDDLLADGEGVPEDDTEEVEPRE